MYCTIVFFNPNLIIVIVLLPSSKQMRAEPPAYPIQQFPLLGQIIAAPKHSPYDVMQHRPMT